MASEYYHGNTLWTTRAIGHMQQPKGTVIIPTYNRAHYLGDAIQSVCEQTCNDFELIVVDDGSTADTLDLLHSIHDLGGASVCKFQVSLNKPRHSRC